MTHHKNKILKLNKKNNQKIRNKNNNRSLRLIRKHKRSNSPLNHNLRKNLKKKKRLFYINLLLMMMTMMDG